MSAISTASAHISRDNRVHLAKLAAGGERAAKGLIGDKRFLDAMPNNNPYDFEGGTLALDGARLLKAISLLTNQSDRSLLSRVGCFADPNAVTEYDINQVVTNLRTALTRDGTVSINQFAAAAHEIYSQLPSAKTAAPAQQPANSTTSNCKTPIPSIPQRPAPSLDEQFEAVLRDRPM